MSNKSELWLAVKNGDIARIKQLAQTGVNLNMHSRLLYGLPGKTALHVAVKSWQKESARVLIELGADVNAVDATENGTPLCLAVYEGNSDMVRFLIENGADPDVLHSRVGILLFKYPILYTALWLNKEDCALALIEGGVNIKKADKDGDTPLHIAAKHNCAKAVRALLAKGANPNVRNKKRELPIDLTWDPACRTALTSA